MSNPEIMKHPDNMTRKEKLDHIRYLKQIGKGTDAMAFWIRECPRISRKAFDDA